MAAYCRVSTEQEEQQNSYQVQIAYYTDLINRKKEWTLAGIFADEGISGTQAKKRPEFLKMIRLCKKQKIDIVITKSISRFARNTVDCLEYVRQLKDLGIGVIFEKENINTMTMTSEFMIALYGSFAQAESESISKNVSWGKGYELQFRHHATIEPNEESEVPVLLWELDSQDEKFLDRYEGEPKYYRKENISLELNGETVEAMVYIMNGDTPLEAPTEQYYGIIKQGYKENGLDTRYLETAFEEAVLAENMEFESKFGMEIF